MENERVDAFGARCTVSDKVDDKTRNIPIELIRNRSDHNRFLDQKHVEHLMGSIVPHGLRHPITLLAVKQWYEIIAGLHRFEACRQLGFTHIEAKLLDPSTSEAELTAISLAENSVRKDESLSSQLARIDRIMRELDCSFEEAAKRACIGKSKTSKLKTAKNGLCNDAIDLVDNNPKKIGISIAYDVARRAKSDAAQIEALESILDGTMTRDEMVKFLKGNHSSPKKKIKLQLTLEGIAIHLGVPESTSLDKLIAICGQLKTLLTAEKKHDRLLCELPDHIGGKHVATE